MSPSSEILSTVEGCVSCDMNGERVVLNTNSGIYFGLNGIGSRVWELLGEPRSADAVVETMLNEFDVSEETLRNDITQFLSKLTEHCLVKSNETLDSQDTGPKS